MTVLAKYQRLEAEAVWRASPDAQRRDVIVSIGDATLTIAAANGTALTHWSLPAIERLNSGQRPALFAPGPEAPETLEIDDPMMIDALGRVAKALARARARPGRLRGTIVLGISLAVAAVLAIWLPGALTRYTAALVPSGARAVIGRDLLAEVRRLTGPPCEDPSGLRALARLEARLFPDGGTRLVVLPTVLEATANLPGGTILIGRRLIEQTATPEALAGQLLAEDMRRRAADPMTRLLSDAGFVASLTLLTTGRVPETALIRHAEALVGRAPRPVDGAGFAARLAQAQLPGADGADPSGAEPPPVLSDGNWIALRRICER